MGRVFRFLPGRLSFVAYVAKGRVGDELIELTQTRKEIYIVGIAEYPGGFGNVAGETLADVEEFFVPLCIRVTCSVPTCRCRRKCRGYGNWWDGCILQTPAPVSEG